MVANDPSGPSRSSAQRWARKALSALTGSSDALIAHGKRWASSGDNSVIVHEESLDYAQHLVLLYGAEEGPAPADCELVLWILGCSQLIGGWEIEDTTGMTPTEAMISEQSRVARFNNSEEPVTLLVRVAELFNERPFAGKLAAETTWNAIEQAAFGCSFSEHFETRVLPWFIQSFAWGKADGVFPIIEPKEWVKNSGAVGDQIVDWLWKQARTREQLVEQIRASMNGLALPRAPSALLYNPIVKISDELIAVASPWKVLAYLRTGIWFAFMEGTKAVLGKNALQDWTSAFGYMFEQWLRKVARDAETDDFKGQVLLPEHPGSEDEIDDVVVLEGKTVILFSAKARLIEKSVSRDAKSKRMVIDWHRKFLFAEEERSYRVGAVRQFNANIEKIRAGKFPNVPKDARIVPVLVTYDMMCEEALLYEWIEQRCASLGLLQQPNVAPLSIAHVHDFERLFGRASRGLSLAQFFRERETSWKRRRLQNQIGVTAPGERLAQLQARFVELMNSTSTRLFGKPLSPEINERLTE